MPAPKISFLALRTRLNGVIWPSGAPENLAEPIKDNDGNIVAPAPLTMLYNEALAEISKWVECERTRNVDIIRFCNTFFSCGMTVVESPHGIVRRVYTVASEDDGDLWCDKVFYQQRKWPEPECWMRNLMLDWVSPSNTGLTTLPLGFKRAESTTDRDSDDNTFDRARIGLWSVYDEKIWVAPWIQSNEKLVIEWRGIKTEWKDDDLVTATQDYLKAVKLYVQYGFERDWGDINKSRTIHDTVTGRGTFDEALADLIWECRERTKVQQKTDEICDNTAIEMSHYVADLSSVIPEATTPCGCMRNGEGAPSAGLGDDGDGYVDTLTNQMYFKNAGAWTVVSSGVAGAGATIGVVDPEGVVTANPGAFYFNTVNQTLWFKVGGTGNTGWLQLI